MSDSTSIESEELTPDERKALDRVLSGLVGVSQRLDEATSPREKAELRDEYLRLKANADELAERLQRRHPSVEELRRRARHLEERIDELIEERINTVSQAGGGSGGGDFGFTADAQALNEEIDDARDRDTIEGRLEDAKRRLDELE